MLMDKLANTPPLFAASDNGRVTFDLAAPRGYLPP